jgi:hypothetical protein
MIGPRCFRALRKRICPRDSKLSGADVEFPQSSGVMEPSGHRKLRGAVPGNSSRNALQSADPFERIVADSLISPVSDAPDYGVTRKTVRCDESNLARASIINRDLLNTIFLHGRSSTPIGRLSTFENVTRKNRPP